MTRREVGLGGMGRLLQGERVMEKKGGCGRWFVGECHGSAVGGEDEDFGPAVVGVVAEEDAEGTVGVDFEDDGADGVAAAVFEAGDVDLGDVGMVDVSDFAEEVFLDAAGVADVGVAVEDEFDVGGEGEETRGKDAGAVAAGEGSVSGDDDGAIFGGDFGAELGVDGVVIGVIFLVAGEGAVGGDPAGAVVGGGGAAVAVIGEEEDVEVAEGFPVVEIFEASGGAPGGDLADGVPEGGDDGEVGAELEEVEVVVSVDVTEGDVEGLEEFDLHGGHFVDVGEVGTFDGVAEIPELLAGEVEGVKVIEGDGHAAASGGGVALLEVGEDPDAVECGGAGVDEVVDGSGHDFPKVRGGGARG